jgi:hypothetical protein
MAMRRRIVWVVLWCVLTAGCDEDGARPDAGVSDGGRDAGRTLDGRDAAPDARRDGGPADGGSALVPARDRARVFFVGHSLVNFDMPAMLEQIARSAGVDHAHGVQVGNGAPLRWHWERPETTSGERAAEHLPSGRYDVLVLTEGLPITEHVRYSDSARYVAEFANLAARGNPDVQVYLYQTWYSLEDMEMEWRARIDAERAVWEALADEVSAARSGPPVLLVPAGTALGRLVDRIEAGEVPGLRSRAELFTDDIHLNDLGNYFVALVQLATLYRRSPVGVVRETVSRFGQPFEAPSPELARVMQEVAWEVVSSDPRAGVRADSGRSAPPRGRARGLGTLP